MALTLSQKVWERHVIARDDGRDLLYVDLHLIHEVTSPQAFDGLRAAGRGVRRPDLTLATADHNVATGGDTADPVSRRQVDALTQNCAEHGIRLFPYGSAGQGIVHVIAPQMGLTQPGMTVVCGDSHTSTHGAFGAIAFGIGTSEVEHVLATQTLWQARPRTLAVEVDGTLPADASAKDLALAIVAALGPGGGAGHVAEYRGAAVRALSMEERMTVCNMSIEAGSRAGLIAPDDVTYAYLERRAHAPKGPAWTQALDAGVGGVAYNAQVSTAADFSVVASESGWTPAQSWTFTGLADGVRYHFRVVARDAFFHNSSPSASVSTTMGGSGTRVRGSSTSGTTAPGTATPRSRSSTRTPAASSASSR